VVDPPFDWDYPRVLLAALAAVTVVSLLVVASTSTAAFGTYNPAWDGASDLREVARDTGADATVARNLGPYGEADPRETVAVVLAPEEAYTDAEASRLRTFLENGGTLVVADDFGTAGNALLADLGADSRIDGTLLRDERSFYQSPELPRATNVTDHRLTAGVEVITLNHASAVHPNGATVLASTSTFAYADANRNGRLDDEEALGSYPVITTEPVGDGTLVVAGDPSLFINVMLEQPGNAAFVRNLFGANEVVLLDYSHAGGIPPLSLAVLVLRESAALQVLLGLGGLGAIGLWASGRWPSLGRIRASPTDPTPILAEDELLAYVERQHPDWDADRTERVVRGLKTDRPQSRRDE
jgi:hypothetical protein